MTFNTFDYLNYKVRILRASFTGEQGYEIYVPPKYALTLWERIFTTAEMLIWFLMEQKLCIY